MKRKSYMKNLPASPTHKRRANPRSRQMLLVSYTVAEGLPPEYTETYDIAVGGLAMFTNAALTPDLDIAIELELRGDSRPKLRLSGKVRWSAYDPLLEKYRTGIAFATHSPDFELEILRYIDTLAMIRDRGTN